MAARLGSGARFAALKSKLSKRPGVTDPGALAASIGRKKYGATKMSAMAAAARSHMPPGASQSPRGNIGALRQAEARRAGGFTGAKDAVNKIKGK